MAKRRKKSRWIGRILLLVLLVIAAAIAWFFLAPTFKTAGSSAQYLPYTVQTRDITTSLSFSGTVEVLHTQQITAQEGQTVREIFVEDSQMVKKGDKLIQLEDGEMFTSNMDGVVNQVRARKGGYAVPGQSLVQVCDLKNLQITLSVDEYDISSFSIGQPCQMYFLALEETFQGEISHINKVSNGMGTMASYTVSIELTAPESVLPGMQVCVTIPQEQLTAQTVLPIEAITFDEEGPCVYLARGDKMERTAVVLGKNDQQYVQLLEGPLPGQQVYAINTVPEGPEEVTLATLYQRLFGKTVVVNEPQLSAGRERRPEGAQRPESTEMPEGMNFPEGMEMPPDGPEPPDDFAPFPPGESGFSPMQSSPGQSPGQSEGE